jgi:hypothetical protein
MFNSIHSHVNSDKFASATPVYAQCSLSGAKIKVQGKQRCGRVDLTCFGAAEVTC